LLREDNADLRLTEKGRELGLVDDRRWQAFSEKREAIEKTLSQLKSTWVRVGHNDSLKSILEAPLVHDCLAMDLLKRPEINYKHLQAVDALDFPQLNDEVALQVEIQSKYAGYIERQELDILKLQKNENTHIPEDFPFESVSGLSIEVIQKLSKIKPATIAQAGRISGITPAALSLLLVSLKKQRLIG
jgi:tRNA uridine 5-carboxymethylaminomethyl modification enzyme